MNRLMLQLLCVSVILPACMACGRHASDSDGKDSINYDSVRSMNDLTDEAWRWADSVMDTMTDEQLVGQLFMPAMYARATSSDMTHLMDYAKTRHVGGIVLLKGDLTSAATIADTLRTIPGPGLFVAIDAENGLKMRLADAPEFPWSDQLGKLTDEQLLYDFGAEIARECRAIGVSMVLGPVIDIVPGNDTHALMRKRSLGSDPKRVADLAIAYSRGLEDGNIISVAKHFPGHGSASGDSHRQLGVIHTDAVRLDTIDLYPFRRYAESLLSGVMVGHLAAESLDTIRRPAIVSPVLMQDLLRGELGFGGLVLTDALNMEGAMGVDAWQAIAAGADIVIAPSDTHKEIAKTLKALHDGRISRDAIHNRVRRILFFKYLTSAHTKQRIDIPNAIREVKAIPENLRDSLYRKRPWS